MKLRSPIGEERVENPLGKWGVGVRVEISCDMIKRGSKYGEWGGETRVDITCGEWGGECGNSVRRVGRRGECLQFRAESGEAGVEIPFG